MASQHPYGTHPGAVLMRMGGGGVGRRRGERGGESGCWTPDQKSALWPVSRCLKKWTGTPNCVPSILEYFRIFQVKATLPTPYLPREGVYCCLSFPSPEHRACAGGQSGPKGPGSSPPGCFDGLGWLGPGPQSLQRTWKGVREGRIRGTTRWGLGRTMKPQAALLNPLSLLAGPESGASLHPSKGRRGQELGRALGSGAKQPAAEPGPAPPLGALPGEGPRRLPMHSGCGERSRPASRGSPIPAPQLVSVAAGVAGAGGVALAPPQPSEEGGSLPASGRGRSRRSPFPPVGPRVKCGRRLRPLQLPGRPHLGHTARAGTWSNCRGGSARRLRSAAAPLSCPAGSGESKGLGVPRGLRGAGIQPDQAPVFSRGCTAYGAPSDL